MAKRIYLDHNATTPLRTEVASNWKKYWEIYGNPNSVHAEGRRARMALDEARERIAHCLGSPRRGVVFVGSGSEGNNQVVASVPPGAPIITSAIEHACIRNAARARHSRLLTELPVDSAGLVSVDDLAVAITPETGLVTIMLANNETGVIQPVQSMAEMARRYGVFMHTDATQAAGKVPVSMENLGVGAMTVTAHKLGGPKGIAAVLISDDAWLKPFIVGGPQERNLRAGTECVPLAVAFADALELAVADMDVRAQRHREFKAHILARLDGIGSVEINSVVDGLPNTLNISINGFRGEHVVRNMDLAGIAISTGSACSTGAVDPSHVIAAFGKPAWVVDGAFRVSMGADTTLDDISIFCDRLLSVCLVV